MLTKQVKSLYINDAGKPRASVAKLRNNTAINLDPIDKIDIINPKWNSIIYYELDTDFDRMD